MNLNQGIKMKVMTKCLISAILLVAFVFSAEFLGFKMEEFFAPKKAALATKVFKEGQAYNEGMVRDLENIKIQYENSTKDQKMSLRAIAIHRFSIYDKEKLPYDLESFYEKLKKDI